MTENEATAAPAVSWVPLNARERRVLGVLVEKAKTTPEYYPLTVAAIVTGCNQKSNRDPVVTYDADDVEDTLHALRKKGATILVEGGGRVQRWKHTMYDWLKVSKVELAVVAELLLRGPQTEGDLRARASRMEPLADLPALQAQLEALASRNLVVYLSPPGQKRGVIVTHGLYPPEELAKVRQAAANAAVPADDEPAPRSSTTRGESAPGWREEIAALRAEVEELRGRVDALTAELRELRTELGA
ncbi:YceH family protein [Paludisphaera soli]|uniref:YceH family protein n=1 Tax=Paludisphaera soli TaxID=2712865 RepID=UPI0013EE293A|nr:DUF480 domain-containing protein [Paludisphaera soli]